MTNQEWAKHLLRMNLDLSGLYHSVIYVLLTKASMTFKIRYQLSGITFSAARIIMGYNPILGTSPSLNTQCCFKRLLVVCTVFVAFQAARTVLKTITSCTVHYSVCTQKLVNMKVRKILILALKIVCGSYVVRTTTRLKMGFSNMSVLQRL